MSTSIFKKPFFVAGEVTQDIGLSFFDLLGRTTAIATHSRFLRVCAVLESADGRTPVTESELEAEQRR